MSLLRSLSDGLRSLFRKEQVGRELDEELWEAKGCSGCIVGYPEVIAAKRWSH